MTDDQLRMIPRLHPSTFKGYPETTLLEIAKNPALNRPGGNIGYEGMFNEAAKLISPDNPVAFGNYLQQNIRRMDPYGIKKLFDYVDYVNSALPESDTRGMK